MKFKWKTKAFIGGLLTLVLMGFGVEHPEFWSNAGANVACEKVKCDA